MIEFIIIFIIILIIIVYIPGVGNAIDEFNETTAKKIKEWENEGQNNDYENSEEYKRYIRRLELSIKQTEIENKRLAAELDDSTFWVKEVPKINKKAYLQSEKWNQLRKAVLKRDHYCCRKCNASGILLDVHHLHYRTLGNESLDDLVTLCRPCHDSLHELYGYYPHHTFPLDENDILGDKTTISEEDHKLEKIDAYEVVMAKVRERLNKNDAS